MRTAPVLLLATTVTTLGCLGPRVTVLPGAVHTQQKPPTCAVAFIRTKVDRPYDEIAGLAASGGHAFMNGPDDFQEALREKACELGADAVIVTRDFARNGGTMNVVAIKYR
jgi:hypothetical protein